MKPGYMTCHLCCILLACTCAVGQDRGSGGTSTPTSVSGGSRVALVIGNSAYQDERLQNPVNDAGDMAAVLRDCGFSVTLITDATYEVMDGAVADFGHMIRGADTALFYFAGHGLQVESENFLVPIDATLESPNEAKHRCLSMGLVLAKMDSAGANINIVILDACRNNPFARRFRSAQRGLASMEAAKGTVIVYATAPGEVAADGDGRNGVFTKHLLQNLATPGIELRDVLMQTRIDVARETGDKQVPWENSSLMGHFYFHGKDSGNLQGPAASPQLHTGQYTGSWTKTNGRISTFTFYLVENNPGRYRAVGTVEGWTCWEVFTGQLQGDELLMKGVDVTRNTRPKDAYALDTLRLRFEGGNRELRGNWEDNEADSGPVILRFVCSAG